MEYNYTEATKRISNLRPKVIIQKGGESVEGLTPLELKSNSDQQKGKQQKTQEIN